MFDCQRLFCQLAIFADLVSFPHYLCMKVGPHFLCLLAGAMAHKLSVVPLKTSDVCMYVCRLLYNNNLTMLASDTFEGLTRLDEL